MIKKKKYRNYHFITKPFIILNNSKKSRNLIINNPVRTAWAASIKEKKKNIRPLMCGFPTDELQQRKNTMAKERYCKKSTWDF